MGFDSVRIDGCFWCQGPPGEKGLSPQKSEHVISVGRNSGSLKDGGTSWVSPEPVVPSRDHVVPDKCVSCFMGAVLRERKKGACRESPGSSVLSCYLPGQHTTGRSSLGPSSRAVHPRGKSSCSLC